MDRTSGPPRGLVSRSLVAVVVSRGSVVPGWTLGDLAERWTGNGLLVAGPVAHRRPGRVLARRPVAPRGAAEGGD